LMARPVVIGWKCKAGAHHGTPKTVPLPQGAVVSWHDTLRLVSPAHYEGRELVYAKFEIVNAECHYPHCGCVCHKEAVGL
jgi:hypothetical protein